LVEPFPKRDLQGMLRGLVVSSDSRLALLITRDGHVVAEAGDLLGVDSTSLAALTAGMFSATREVARLVGETQFSILLQQGERRHIHISLIGESTMMVVVFEDYQKIGRVRYEARKAGKVIGEALQAEAAVAKPLQEEGFSITAFREYALNLIDRLFEPKSPG